ncbi:MAG: NUDIX domain-containing protein [Ruminococcaceae bacterium]|nr:NUDIX domain-containing protein [Oscillospiraceae bacterium]
MILSNSIKAIIIDKTRLLVVHMRDSEGNEYYTLPGGKQRPDELMLDALKREVKEETGYDIQPKSLLFIREGFKEESHRIEFMFICDIVGEKSTELEYDVNQIGTKWISIDNILHEELYPVDMRNIIKRHFLGKSNEIYLGEMQ